jgi:hypothetical protein
MIVQLSSEQRDMLLRLLDAETAALSAEIHHTRTYKDPLKDQRRTLLGLRELLSDVPASTELVGMSCATSATDAV